MMQRHLGGLDCALAGRAPGTSLFAFCTELMPLWIWAPGVMTALKVEGESQKYYYTQ